jgi:hypothetical protein
MISRRLKKGLYKYCQDPYFQDLYNSINEENQRRLNISILNFNNHIDKYMYRLKSDYVNTIEVLNEYYINNVNITKYDINSFRAYFDLIMKFGGDNPSMIEDLNKNTMFNQELNKYLEYLKSQVKN